MTSSVVNPLRKPMRRAPQAVIALATSCALLVGCGSDGGGDDAPASASAQTDLLPEAEGNTEYPLTLTTWAGETVLEERPERIALVGLSDGADVLQGLGVTPVYTLTELQEWPWQDHAWFDGIETVDSATRNDPVNVEGIAQTDPDLIISLGFLPEEADYDRLADIAPVLDYETRENMPGWRDTHLLVGEILDLKESAQSAVDDAEQAIDAVAEAHPEFSGSTLAYAHQYSADYGLEYLAPSGGNTDTLLQELGFSPSRAAEVFADDVAISDENVGLLDADVLIISYQEASDREARENDDLFRSLAPVQDGRYISLTQTEDDSGNVGYAYADGSEAPGVEVGWVMRRGASVLSFPWAADVFANEWLAEIDLT